jgi:hypothetical protein
MAKCALNNPSSVASVGVGVCSRSECFNSDTLDLVSCITEMALLQDMRAPASVA